MCPSPKLPNLLSTLKILFSKLVSRCDFSIIIVNVNDNTTSNSNIMSADDVTFESFGLDPRLNQAITRLQFSKPTLVQATAIPLALEQRKDIIARARTGSGKTVAYAIPVIESILQEEQAGNRAIVLVPSKELADQVTKLFKSLTIYCGKTVQFVT